MNGRVIGRLLISAMLVCIAASSGTGPLRSVPRIPSALGSDTVARPDIVEGHPRLIVGGLRGPSIEELRAACLRPELKGACDTIGGRHILDDAMLWLLFEDREAAARVESRLMSDIGCGDGFERSSLGGHAIAFDWTFDALTDPDGIADDLARCAGEIASPSGLRGNSPHLWHGYTSQAAALALVALALDPEHPDRDTLLDDAAELFRGHALEAYEVVGGAWPEGYNYLRSHFFSGDPPSQYVIDALRAWNTAVVRDHPDHESIFETIRNEEGDWLSGLAYHLVYGTLDDGTGGPRTLMRGGDLPTGQANPHKQYRPFIDAIARAYKDGVLAQWGADLEDDWPFISGDGTYHSIHAYSLPYTLPIDVAHVKPDALPRARVWAKDTLGYAISRSGFGFGSTVVSYRAGDWFTGHQHMDQGHIDIWRDGPLAVDGGVYANWGSEHREAYYMRSVAHNTLLIHRDGETFDEHPRSPVNVNDDGQRVMTYRGCPQCMQSLEEWRSNVGDGLHLEAGRIEAYSATDNYTMIQSDLTSAYNSTRYASPGNVAKVESVQRDVVHVMPDVVLVFDRVRTTEGTGPPRFVLHLAGQPKLADGTLVSGSDDDGIIEGPMRELGIANSAGAGLNVKTLFPDEARVTLIGGPNHRYWVDGANRDDGAEGLDGQPAAPGEWRMEVTASSPGRDTLLVHGLTTSGGGGVSSPEAGISQGADPTLGGVPVAIDTRREEISTIVANAEVPRGAIRFAEFQHDPPGEVGGILIMDLPEGATARLVSDRARGVSKLTTVDKENAWAISGIPAGRYYVAVCPAPEGAGIEWNNVCDTGVGLPTPTPSLRPTEPTEPGTPTPVGTAATDWLILPILDN